VSDYGLDNRATGVRSPAGAKDSSSSLCVQTASGAHPASCTMGTGGPFTGGKARPGRVADYSPPSSAEVVNEWVLYLLSPQAPPWRVEGLLYFYFSSIGLYQRFSNCGGRPPGRGAVGLLSLGAVVCMRDIFALHEIWAQYKKYIVVGTLFG
jgi:hypothetical protein